MKTIVSIVAIVIVTGVVASIWYENHVSAQFKRTLTALVDPSSTKDDVHTYLREARVQAVTRADKKLLTTAEEAVSLDVKADELSESNFAALMTETKDPYQFCHPFYAELKLFRGATLVPVAQMQRLAELKARARDGRAKNSKDLIASIDLQKRDVEESLRLLDSLRDWLGAPGKGHYVANTAPTYEVLTKIKGLNDAIQKVPEDYMDEVESETIGGKKSAVSSPRAHKVTTPSGPPLPMCADTNWALPCRT